MLSLAGGWRFATLIGPVPAGQPVDDEPPVGHRGRLVRGDAVLAGRVLPRHLDTQRVSRVGVDELVRRGGRTADRGAVRTGGVTPLPRVRVCDARARPRTRACGQGLIDDCLATDGRRRRVRRALLRRDEARRVGRGGLWAVAVGGGDPEPKAVADIRRRDHVSGRRCPADRVAVGAVRGSAARIAAHPLVRVGRGAVVPGALRPGQRLTHGRGAGDAGLGGGAGGSLLRSEPDGYENREDCCADEGDHCSATGGHAPHKACNGGHGVSLSCLERPGDSPARLCGGREEARSDGIRRATRVGFPMDRRFVNAPYRAFRPDRGVRPDAVPLQQPREPLQLGARGDAKCGVRFRRGREVDAHPDMELVQAGAEPHVASALEERRLLELVEPKPATVEPAGVVLSAGRRGDLDMVEPDDHGHSPGCSALRVTPGRKSEPASPGGCPAGLRRRRYPDPSSLRVIVGSR